MGIRPTISQIAEMAHVSNATVSRYINGSAKVKPATASAIKNAIEKLEYRLPDDCPTSIVNNKSNIILIIVPGVSNSFYHEIIRGIQNTALTQEFTTLIYSQNINASTENIIFDMINKQIFAGAITLGPLSNHIFMRLYKSLPFVQCCECTSKQDFVSYVTIDDYAATKGMVEYLISMGHKKIGFLMGPERYKYSRERRSAYLDTLKAAHVEFNPDWLVQSPNLDFYTAFSAASQIIKLDNKPTAICTVSDSLAAATIRACYVNGLNVPSDMAVTGFDNISLSQMTFPAITTISQPKYQLGSTACDLLLEKLKQPDTKPQHLILDTELVIRESTQF